MQYMSVKEAAAQWDVTIQMVRRYCQKGMVPQVVQENGGWRIPAGHSLPGNEYLFGQLFLGKAVLGSKMQNYVFCIHIIHLMTSIPDCGRLRKQHAVAEILLVYQIWYK